MWHMYKYVKNTLLKQDIFQQHIEMPYVFRDYILTLALYTVHMQICKHRWHQI